MVRELVALPSSPPPHGEFQQPVLGYSGRGLEVDEVEVPMQEKVKSLNWILNI